MIYLEEQKEEKADFWDLLYAFILRVMSMMLIGVTLYYWLRVIGYFDGKEFLFATMSTHWKVASLMMAIFAPVAAIGLWMLSPWGVVIAIMLAIGNLLMFGFMSEFFGFHFLFFMIFLSCLGLLLAFHAIFWWRHR
jgi:hypothetical protein